MTLTVIFTVTLLAAAGVYLYHFERIHQTNRLRDIKVQYLRDAVTHLDEVLTMSARMGALTGDLQWEQRYRKYEPEFEHAVDQIVKIFPRNSNTLTAETSAAKRELMEMENRAFDLTREGHFGAAKNILFGQKYEEQRKFYAEEMLRFSELAAGEVGISIESDEEKVLVYAGWCFIFSAVLILMWLVSSAVPMLGWTDRSGEGHLAERFSDSLDEGGGDGHG